MDAVAVFGAGNPPTESSRSFNYTQKHIVLQARRRRRRRRQQLSAFPASRCNHFSKLSTRRPRANSLNNESNISLPHSVASPDQLERTYIMIKPDGVQRGLVGEIISRFKRKGFKLIGLKLYKCSKDLAEEHYKELKEVSFFPSIIDYITSGPVVCMAWEGIGVVATARRLIGGTNPFQSEPGTIRGDFAIQVRGDLSIQKGRARSGHVGKNVIHGSHDPESGKHEIALWFKEGELVQWEQAQAPWLGK